MTLPRQSVHDMSIDELRARVRQATALLRIARERVRESFKERTEESATAAGARLNEIFEELHELLPGIGEAPKMSREEREERQTVETDIERVAEEIATLPNADPNAPPLSKDEQAEWDARMAELEDGIERAELLGEVSDESSELADLIQTNLDNVRRDIALGLTAAEHAKKQLS